MKRYDTYKPSGIEWLGVIPEHWEVKRFKDLAYSITGLTYSPDDITDENEGTLVLRSGNIQNSCLDFTNNVYVSCKINKTLYFKKGDILLCSRNGSANLVGKSAYIDQSYKYTWGAFMTVARSKMDKYLFYSLNSDLLKINMGLFQTSTVNQLTARMLDNMTFLKPPLSEQTAIANYLDTKTAAIDRKIELLTAKANKYKALRRSLINETVCRGLNPTAPLKDSGIEWIGMIPEHWEVKRFKSIANTVKGRNLELSDTYFENSLPNLSLEYLRNESVVFDTYCFTPDKNQKVSTDDMIIIWDGAGVGEILNGKDGFLSSTIAKIVVDKKKYNSKFLYNLRFSIEYILKMIPAGMGIPHLNPQVLNSFNCPCPPIDEQTEIVEYLNEKTTQIDTILTNISEQISKLTQLRKTLINDVVTGKIKVTGRELI